MLRGLGQLHEGWVFAGASAAVAHELSVSWRLLEPLEIAGAYGGRTFLDGRVRTRRVVGDRPVRANGVRATSLERTVLDCVRSMPLRDALAVIDSALASGELSRSGFEEYVDIEGAGCHGVGRARLAALLADGRAGSGGESIARAAMYELGFALPELQTEVRDPMDGRVYFADFCWELDDGRVVYGELDGGEKYENPEMTQGRGALWKMRRERLRESRLTLGGRAVVRFSLEDVADARYFNDLLLEFGVPKVREPLIEIPERRFGESAGWEDVPEDVYWFN